MRRDGQRWRTRVLGTGETSVYSISFGFRGGLSSWLIILYRRPTRVFSRLLENPPSFPKEKESFRVAEILGKCPASTRWLIDRVLCDLISSNHLVPHYYSFLPFIFCSRKKKKEENARTALVTCSAHNTHLRMNWLRLSREAQQRTMIRVRMRTRRLVEVRHACDLLNAPYRMRMDHNTSNEVYV